MSFLKISVSTLYDEYIDRPKLSEQKKPFEYIVPPQEGSEQTCQDKLDRTICMYIKNLGNLQWSWQNVPRIIKSTLPNKILLRYQKFCRENQAFLRMEYQVPFH